MEFRPIRTDDDHRLAVEEIKALWNSVPGTPESDRLGVWVSLVDEYERQRWPTERLDPIEHIEAHMEMNGYSRADLGRLIGGNRATEILDRKRPLTLAMIRTIAAAWHLPVALLVEEYELAA